MEILPSSRLFICLDHYNHFLASVKTFPKIEHLAKFLANATIAGRKNKKGAAEGWPPQPIHRMTDGLHRCFFSIATRPQPSHTYFMAASLSLHICLSPTSGAPQKLHLALSPQGLHKCPGSLATAPQFLHVYAMVPSFS